MKRRIVKETCLCGASRPDVFTRPRERFVVEMLNGLGKWEIELIPIADGFQENVPAVFLTEEDALMYVNGEYGKIGREVIWEGEQ